MVDFGAEARLLSNNKTAERRVILLIWSIKLVLPFFMSETVKYAVRFILICTRK